MVDLFLWRDPEELDKRDKLEDRDQPPHAHQEANNWAAAAAADWGSKANEWTGPGTAAAAEWNDAAAAPADWGAPAAAAAAKW
ncbi:40S ribosomal protein S0-A, putative [Eimeria necatrix]|uniref:40S ribosomal protein S0-A, putative n=1 Tax=Eimeria necatrix TaxID=51315 RepID=U6MHY3_9EIME|nr:40S ribosomal protein S0-A, putative [Eimeria necatrix]CDJ62678.1 40S ribosomal protein S0-A, putative [Eimeria necatrix]